MRSVVALAVGAGGKNVLFEDRSSGAGIDSPRWELGGKMVWVLRFGVEEEEEVKRDLSSRMYVGVWFLFRGGKEVWLWTLGEGTIVEIEDCRGRSSCAVS